VADGTEVPVGVVVDYGVAVRACSVRVRTGAPLDTVGATAPCVSEWGSGTWSISHRDDSAVVRAGDVVTLRRATPVVAPAERIVVKRLVTAPSARITGVTRRRGRLVITTSGAERIGVARVSGRRCRPVRASGRLGRRVACGDALSMLPGPRLELRAGPGRYLIRADGARLVVTLR
jgi:hypothetical protein